MKRDLIIRLSLDEAELREFGRLVMVTPLTEDEAAGLRLNLITVHQSLGGLAIQMDDVIEQSAKFPEAALVVAGLTAWRDLVEGLHARVGAVAAIVGRGKFVAGGGE